uniref:Uncharacterized protein n=1 Tax=Anguilla anguilla TaxID=7936 RepID=A0A0E9X692_ANGAN
MVNIWLTVSQDLKQSTDIPTLTSSKIKVSTFRKSMLHSNNSLISSSLMQINAYLNIYKKSFSCHPINLISNSRNLFKIFPQPSFCHSVFLVNGCLLPQ